MPAKKKEEPKKCLVLGRPNATGLSIGIVGLPNVGKSTFFNVVTKNSVPAENFPFCTIDPSEARINVPDARFTWLCEKFKPKSEVPPFLSITDIAGLVKGAAEGEGLGNAFLSHIRAVDGIYHMIRVFADEDITHVEGDVNPVRDLEIIEKELILKDIESVQTHKAKLERQARTDKLAKEYMSYLDRLEEHLQADRLVRMGEWNQKEIEYLNTLQLLTAKGGIFLVNMTPEDYIRKKNKWLPKIKEWIDQRTREPLIPISAQFEQNISEMSPEEREKYLEENKVQSCLEKVVTAGYKTLNLCHFFTAGADEVKCWTIQKLTKAPQAAGRIHTDFEKGFICAEVMPFEALKEHGTEVAVKAAGQYRQQGREYVVEDGDIIFFKFNVGKGKVK